jgi:uncharacterized protein (UPF0248 family)
MMPIHELLSRIRHDQEFGRGRFEIGYFDRAEGTIRRVAFQQIEFPAGERRAFELLDESGQPRRIPFHRVREVYKDGQRIWQRPT